MNRTERDAAIADHAEARRLTQSAATALAAAKAEHAAAVAKRAELVRQAAAGSGLPAADLVNAGRTITDAEAAAELASAILDAAQHRERTASLLAREAERADRDDRRNAAIARRIAAAERLDAAIAAADEAIAEMVAAGVDARANGLPGFRSYVVSITEQPISAFGFQYQPMRDIAEIETRTMRPVLPGAAAA